MEDLQLDGALSVWKARDFGEPCLLSLLRQNWMDLEGQTNCDIQRFGIYKQAVMSKSNVMIRKYMRSQRKFNGIGKHYISLPCSFNLSCIP